MQDDRSHARIHFEDQGRDQPHEATLLQASFADMRNEGTPHRRQKIYNEVC